ncbi:MAG: NAD(P)-dependent oxidoreductase [Lachnospiraceae bacterium]|nr:NAD(P)-dependent oxidoreductase [Lachnospiraceae bacterium]
MEYKTSMLVGYTGFVGSNIDAAHQFTYRINSKNSDDAIGKKPDLLIYAGLRAEKYLANHEPEKDRATILDAFERIKGIRPGKVVLISTVDVYKDPKGVDEDTRIDASDMGAYGANRYELECLVRNEFADALIIRLPGLFGKNIRKNFIYDFINVIPTMLKADKYNELAKESDLITKSYTDMGNGFYKCSVLSEDAKRVALKEEFGKVGFSALNFTDSKGVYQFYDLGRLWSDIETALANDIKLLNIATEPVSISEVYGVLTGGKTFVNETGNAPFYDFRTKHAGVFGGKDGYICDKKEVLESIKNFVERVGEA